MIPEGLNLLFSSEGLFKKDVFLLHNFYWIYKDREENNEYANLKGEERSVEIGRRGSRSPGWF